MYVSFAHTDPTIFITIQAFPRDQPAVQSYVVGQVDEVSPRPKKDTQKDDGDDTPSDESIKRAFTLFDLDKNGYIGVAELRHCLVCMGEVVSDEIIDEMIQVCVTLLPLTFASLSSLVIVLCLPTDARRERRRAGLVP